MIKQKRSAFTLVELIVTITILAILGTIAFMSFQGYSKTARDSVRIADIGSVITTLELFNVGAGKYPEPTNGAQITYKGTNIRTEGVFGDDTRKNVDKLDKTPIDPTYPNGYTYSVTPNKTEYQLGALIETSDVVSNINLVDSSFAFEETDRAYVRGNYNGVVTKILSGSTTYVVALPSIVATDLNDTTLEGILSNKKLSYTNSSNIPSSYKKVSSSGDFDFNSTNTEAIVAYSGTIEDLSNSGSLQADMFDKLKDAYTGTPIENNGNIAEIVHSSGDNDLVLAANLVNNQLGGNTSVPDSNEGGEEGGGESGGDPYSTQVGFYSHFDGTDGSNIFIDEKGHDMNPFENTPDPKPLISTFASKSGGASGKFSGTNWINIDGSEDMTLGTGAFTVEAYVYPTGNYKSINHIINTQGGNVGIPGRFSIFLNSSGQLSYEYDLIRITGTTNISQNLYHHIAVTRDDSNNLYLFIDGNLELSESNHTMDYTLADWRIGTANTQYSGDDKYGFEGYIDEVRITKGVARYTEAFTPSDYSGNPTVIHGTSCRDILENDASKLNQDGIYRIDPTNNGTGVEAYCDMTNDGGGWTLMFKIAQGMGGDCYNNSAGCNTSSMNSTSLTSGGRLSTSVINAMMQESNSVIKLIRSDQSSSDWYHRVAGETWPNSLQMLPAIAGDVSYDFLETTFDTYSDAQSNSNGTKVSGHFDGTQYYPTDFDYTPGIQRFGFSVFSGENGMRFQIPPDAAWGNQEGYIYIK